eukprot:m.56598 g.56598  ORF g.56598 m.56598 type:complete len:753 (-) comp11048_c0_seq1:7649-9907(-)
MMATESARCGNHQGRVLPSSESKGKLTHPSQETEFNYLTAVHTADRIGGYILGKTIGEGAFAKVKESVHMASGEACAIKLIYKTKIKDKYVRENLYREGMLMRRIKPHPNVVPLVEILESERVYCLAMDLASGGELLDYIVTHGHLKEKETRKFVRQLVSAVGHLHSCGVVHRDLKAENLLLGANLDLMIIDFGLANFYETKEYKRHKSAKNDLENCEKDDNNYDNYGLNQKRNLLDTLCGSPAYTAPEVLAGKSYTEAVDIWSIGVNMYAMLTGKLPFNSSSITELHRLATEGNYIKPQVSDDCLDLLAGLLTADEEKRISLKSAANHPWLLTSKNENQTASIIQPPSRRVDSKQAGASPLLNDLVASKITSMGHDKSALEHAMVQNACNHLSATYFFFERKFKRTYGKHDSRRKRMSRRKSDSSLVQGKESETIGRKTGYSNTARTSQVARAHKPISETGPKEMNPNPRNLENDTSNEQDLSKDWKTKRIQQRKNMSAASSPVIGRRDVQASRYRAASQNAHRLSSDQTVEFLNSIDERKVQSNLKKRSTPSPPAQIPAHASRTQDLTMRRSAKEQRKKYSSLKPIADCVGEMSISENSTETSDIIGSDNKFITVVHQRKIRSHRAASRDEQLPVIRAPGKPLSYDISANVESTPLRTMRFPLNERMISSRSPQYVMQELKEALNSLQIVFIQIRDETFAITCKKDSVLFDAEVVQVAGLQMRGIHFHRLKGPAEIYGKLCRDVLSMMQL